MPESLPSSAILYEDPHLIAVNKFAPLLTQAPPGIPSLESMVKAYIKEKHAKPAGVYLGIPHRLDRPVSGVVVFARNTKAAQRVHSQFQERRARKVYWALVEGDVQGDAGVWDDWLRKIAEESRTVAAVEGEAGAKRATLEWRVLRRFSGEPGGCFQPSPLEGEGGAQHRVRGSVVSEETPHPVPKRDDPLPQGERVQASATLIELRPATGRMHQLRVQAALRGHPVRGDEIYGSTIPFGLPGELPRDRVIALHARQLTIEHPFTKSELVIVAELPSYWPISAPPDAVGGLSSLPPLTPSDPNP